MNVIDTTDLASYLRVSALDDGADLLVDLANGIVSAAAGDSADPLSPQLRAITLEVAARAYRNPEGYSSETVDDYTYRLPTEARRAGVYLTATEAAELGNLSRPAPRAINGWLA